MSVALRSRDQKHAAQTILNSLLSRLCEHMSVPAAVASITQEQCLSCPSRLEGNIHCVHIASLQERDERGNRIHGSISTAWKTFMQVLHQCFAVRRGAPAVLQMLAAQLTLGLLATSYTSNPLE
eukprot:4541922-Amphidinium_carterae.1